jgi:predicted secreted protein with PEFG-CTERM motif
VRKIIISLAILVLLIPLVSSSFADTVQIIIMRGAADQQVSRTFSPPSTNALVGETIEWMNGDQVAHSVTSGTPNNPDARFDSGTIGLGQSFSYTLTTADIGVINFYDKTYPWMTGTLNVQATQSGYKIINDVGADAGDGKTTFNLQYASPKDVVSAVVDPKDKSVTFTLVGKVDSNSTLVLNLPNGLVSTPFLGVQVDGQFIKNFTVESQNGINVVKIPITPLTEQVSVVGSAVVPEFGPIAGMILVVSIIATIIVARFRLGHKLA